jgi:alpha-2-macroglobulin
LTQGSDIQVVVKIRNTSARDFSNLALTQILPSGWEIHNQRMQDESKTVNEIDYVDIRDDRILTYFGLKKNQQKTFSISINAAYLGRFYLPAFNVEAMYDASKYARSEGQWVEVIKQQNANKAAPQAFDQDDQP